MGEANQRQGTREPRPGTKAYELQPDKKVVAAKMKRRLLQLGMSQAEFARRVGTDPGTVSKWLKGDALADVRWWNGISFILGATVDDLLAPPTVASVRDTASSEEMALIEDSLPAGYTDHDFDVALRVVRKALDASAKTIAPSGLQKRRPRSSAPPQ
jgi:transcriptional regulator with XRE-family HTH domain